MRASSFLVVLSLTAAAACAPARPCSAATCEGCCTAAGACDPGTSSAVCGAGGRTCDTCVASQVCAPSGRCEAAPAADAGTTMANPTVLTGTRQDVWGWDGDGGRSATTPGFSRSKVGIWYLDGGTLAFHRGFASDDGTFIVREVPAGEVMVQLDRRYFVTSERRLSIDDEVGGRLDAPKATSESLLRLTLRGLDPLRAQDFVALFFTQAQGPFSDVAELAQPPSPAGATSVEGDVDWAPISASLGYGLPDSSKGDMGYALQYRTTPTDGGSVSTLLRATPLPPVTLAHGSTVDVLATLTDAPSQPFPFAPDTGAFAALRHTLGRDPGRGSTASSSPPRQRLGPRVSWDTACRC
ncbi:MAG: hypothetical protein IAE78_33210 [Myxococcus sp.]|nr:hypothetical protein [Myxococcus sp.]